MIKNILFFIFGLTASSYAISQIENYKFKQEVSGIQNEWHKILIPSATFKNLNNNYSDIRIFGITSTDTIEAPYILKEAKFEHGIKNSNFKIINQSHNSSGYFYTFVMDDIKSINQILLNFNQQNFDFQAKLEGSDVKNNWYTIIDNYQLIGIQNRFVDFSFTKLKFAESKYKYYRLQIKTNDNPYLSNASISLQESKAAQQEEFEVVNFSRTENTKDKKTVIEFSLKDELPVSEIQLEISNNVDYYRRYYISHLTDSTKTEKGYIKNYQRLQSGTIHSFEPSIIQFSTIIASQFKIEIENQDNMPLMINSASARGNRFYLTARFNIPAQYFLAFGSKNASFPDYDISYFKEKIPTEMTEVQLGDIAKINQKEEVKTEPLFVNSIWMYILLSAIILLLAVFSISMLKNTKRAE